MNTLKDTPHGGGQASELLMVEQLTGATNSNGAPFILDRHGRKMQGRDDERRTAELRSGLTRHAGVRVAAADTRQDELERILDALHEPEYLDALRSVSWDEPRMMPEWAPPGLPADSPVWTGVVVAAFEGVRTAITAAERIVAGTHFTYALCRPPGHHAGPAWLGGYCYLNTAAAAAYALCEGGVKPVAILDIDFHFPTGTSAIVAPLTNVRLGSLHASTIAEVPWRRVEPGERELFVEFTIPPDADTYLQTLADTIDQLAKSSCAIVLSLGYDIVASDPHGSWDFQPAIFERIGRLLAASGLPICVVQEGGYSLDALAECSHAFATGLLNSNEVAPRSRAHPKGAYPEGTRRQAGGS
jgi:acetoin utilization deacetylase AcuC-like enzyme